MGGAGLPDAVPRGFGFPIVAFHEYTICITFVAQQPSKPSTQPTSTSRPNPGSLLESPDREHPSAAHLDQSKATAEIVIP